MDMRNTEGSRSDALAASSTLWDREYETLQIIPSSTRATPSKALLLFAEILRFEEIGKVLDIGCGNGRNAVYLAQKGREVHALDFSHVALRETQRAALRAGVEDKIHLYKCSLFQGLPFKDESFDLLVDSYVFCHFTDDAFKHAYRQELRRVARPGGKIFCSVFSKEDQYYGSLIENPDDPTPIVVDPRNGIRKQLYTPQAISQFFSEEFDILFRAALEFVDSVEHRPYSRHILALMLEKASKRS
jgi:ubiquinone/menaquinone biosynthesis C-methylase UbiE